MTWCKTDVSDFGWIFFPSKVPEFLHVHFNLVVKHSLAFFFTWFKKKKQQQKQERIKNFPLVAPCCIHCACFDILSLFFSSGNKVQTSQKIQGNVLLLNWRAYAKIQALLKEKKFTWKSHLSQSCIKHSIYRSILDMGWIDYMCKDWITAIARDSDKQYKSQREQNTDWVIKWKERRLDDAGGSWLIAIYGGLIHYLVWTRYMYR